MIDFPRLNHRYLRAFTVYPTIDSVISRVPRYFKNSNIPKTATNASSLPVEETDAKRQ